MHTSSSPSSPSPSSPLGSTRGQYALICRARERLCALPLAQVVETMRPLVVETLAAVPSFVRGLARARGTPLPVVDLGAMLGSGAPPHPTRFVMVRADERRVLLAVEGVLGVRDVGQSQLKDLPPLLDDSGQSAVAAVGILDAALLVMLRAARIIPESTWELLTGRDR